MDIDRFWQLIDQARAAAGPRADQAIRDVEDLDDLGSEERDLWDFDEDRLQALVDSVRGAASPTADLEDGEDDDDSLEGDEDEDGEYVDDLTDPIAVALFDLLAALPAAEIADFDNTFEDLRAQADIPGVIAAASLIEHGLHTSDTFDDFRAGLVALGRATYERALTDPDSLADHPVVREIAAAADPRWFGREDVLFVASQAYAEVTGEDAVTFFDFAEALRETPIAYPDPDGELELWSIENQAEIRAKLPRLSDMFLERALRNRERAEERYRASLVDQG
jgi:hypothetical protein